MCGPVSAFAADVPLPVFLDGVRADKHGPSGLERNGVAYISAVRSVQLFDGLLTFGPRGKVVRVTIDRRTMTFTVGNKVAYLDGEREVLPNAPIDVAGDIYLPLATVARLGSASVAVEHPRGIVSFKSGGGDSFPPAVRPTPQSDDDVQPSPAQALVITTTGNVDDAGLHAQATLRNTTTKAYTLSFPTGKQVAFVVSRDGSEVWNSASTITSTDPSSIVIGPLETKTIAADDPDYHKLGPGRFLLRARLMTLIPLDLPPVSLGVETPSPSASR
jgi:hypothetical protein